MIANQRNSIAERHSVHRRSRSRKQKKAPSLEMADGSVCPWYCNAALPVSAHAGIFDVFSEIFGTIQSDIGSSLKSINQLTQQVQQLYQTTMWPLARSIRPAASLRIRSTAFAAR
jgi:hypothetical protein